MRFFHSHFTPLTGFKNPVQGVETTPALLAQQPGSDHNRASIGVLSMADSPITPLWRDDQGVTDADGKWHVYAALRVHLSQYPELARNPYFRDATNDAFAAMQKAVEDA